MKPITDELLGNVTFRNFLNGLANEKTNRSRLKIMEQRQEAEQVARVRSAALRESIPSYYANYEDPADTATYEDKITALHNLFGIRS